MSHDRQSVLGPAGVTIAFCGASGTYGKESYQVSDREAMANAMLIVLAVNAWRANK